MTDRFLKCEPCSTDGTPMCHPCIHNRELIDDLNEQLRAALEVIERNQVAIDESERKLAGKCACGGTPCAQRGDKWVCSWCALAPDDVPEKTP